MAHINFIWAEEKVEIKFLSIENTWMWKRSSQWWKQTEFIENSKEFCFK